jgi:hypothetical protein
MLQGRARLDMDSPTAPPGNPGSPDAAAAQALFIEARRRRRRRWLAGIGAVLVAAAVVATSAITWLPRALGLGTDGTGAAAAGLVGRSSALTGQARLTYRVVTAGVPEAYGAEDITFSGRNRVLSVSATDLARGPSPTQTNSGTERLVDGQVYDYFRVHGRMSWVHEPEPSYVSPKIIDPRRLLHVLERYTQFQAIAYQAIGGIRLKVLHATNPAHLTRRNLLPVMYTSGQPVASVQVWVDRYGVVHRLAFTSRAPATRIMLSKPVSKAALQAYRRAERALPRVPESQFRRAQRRFDQAMLRAFPVRQGAQVTVTTATFSAIGQPQRITAPPHAVPNCAIRSHC